MIGVRDDDDDGGSVGENYGNDNGYDDDGYKDNCDVGDAHAQGASGMASSPCKRCRSFIFARSQLEILSRKTRTIPGARCFARAYLTLADLSAASSLLPKNVLFVQRHFARRIKSVLDFDVLLHPAGAANQSVTKYGEARRVGRRRRGIRCRKDIRKQSSGQRVKDFNFDPKLVTFCCILYPVPPQCCR